MADIFLKEDVNKILRNKFIVIIGDSIQRSMYKDMVRLLQENRFLTDKELRTKSELSLTHCQGEPAFANDECLVGKGGMHNGVTCREVRQYCTDFHLLRYYYVTRSMLDASRLYIRLRCYNKYMESVLNELTQEPYPDVIVMNSCIWDITRYGDDGIDRYKENMPKLLTRVSQIMNKDCLFMWLSTLPVSETAKGGFIVPDMEVLHDRLRLDILAANQFNHKLITERGFDYVDIHYFLRYHIHRRAEDGIHWDMTAHRRITNTILTHICLAWGFQFPGNARGIYDKSTQKIDAQIDGLISSDVTEAMSQRPQRISRTAKRRKFTPKGTTTAQQLPACLIPNQGIIQPNFLGLQIGNANALMNICGPNVLFPANCNAPAAWMKNQGTVWPNFHQMPRNGINPAALMAAATAHGAVAFSASNYMSFDAPRFMFDAPRPLIQAPQGQRRQRPLGQTVRANKIPGGWLYP